MINLSFRHLIQIMLPPKMRNKVDQLVFKPLYKRMITFFEAHPEIAATYKMEIQYLINQKKIAFFPYPFIEQYEMSNVRVEKDTGNGMNYVIHLGKRLYFPRNMNKNNVKKMYCELCMEQDDNSPHRYFTNSFDVTRDDIFVDVGSAEGMIALETIERSKGTVLFEVDPFWIEALEATFRPWNEKVVIVNKMVSSYVGEDTTTLDQYFENAEDPIVLKIDVEGCENNVLKGAQKTLSYQETRVVCCTYHRTEDSSVLKTILEDHGYKTEFSSGYMLWYHDLKIEPPYFRRGLIRAWH